MLTAKNNMRNSSRYSFGLFNINNFDSSRMEPVRKVLFAKTDFLELEGMIWSRIVIHFGGLQAAFWNEGQKYSAGYSTVQLDGKGAAL